MSPTYFEVASTQKVLPVASEGAPYIYYRLTRLHGTEKAPQPIKKP